MDEQFVSDGLGENRYLKANRLVTQFEDEILDVIDTVCRSVRDAHPDLFDPEDGPSRGRFEGKTIRTVRSEIKMNVRNEEDNRLTFNCGIEWVEPHQQPDGAENVAPDTLCYILYKIKYDSERTFEQVRSATLEADRRSAIRFGEEKFDTPPKVAPGIVYVPVENGSDVVDALEVLEAHFSEEYGPRILSQRTTDD